MEDGWVGGWWCCRLTFFDQSNLANVAFLMAGFVIFGMMLFLSMPCDILGAEEDSNANFKTLKS